MDCMIRAIVRTTATTTSCCRGLQYVQSTTRNSASADNVGYTFTSTATGAIDGGSDHADNGFKHVPSLGAGAQNMEFASVG